MTWQLGLAAFFYLEAAVLVYTALPPATKLPVIIALLWPFIFIIGLVGKSKNQ